MYPFKSGSTARSRTMIGATIAATVVTVVFVSHATAWAEDAKQTAATQIVPSELKWFAEPTLPPGVQRSFVWGNSGTRVGLPRLGIGDRQVREMDRRLPC